MSFLLAFFCILILEKQMSKNVERKMKKDLQWRENCGKIIQITSKGGENMEDLLVKIGEMLDEKLTIVKEELQHEMLELKAELRQEIADVKIELEQEITDAKEELRKEMLDQFFLFEQKYGDRILTVGELALLDNQKNLERAEKMHQLEERMNKNEANIYACQHEIFAL